MDVDYLLIILPSIVLLGLFGLLLVIWQYGNFRHKKESKAEINCSSIKEPFNLSANASAPQRLEPAFSQLSNTHKNSDQSAHLHLLVGDFIVLQLLAPEERPYIGYELVQTLSSAGFHYGAMNIFHYYADPTEKKERLFSIASAIEPGSFDLTHIGEIICPGLCLFMATHKVKNILATFELMLETAHILLQDLGGVLCDKQQQPLTPNDLSHYCSQFDYYAQIIP